METFKHVIPTKEHEKDAIEFINEFHEYSSKIYGVGGLEKYLNDYDGWLSRLDSFRGIEPNENRVPSETFFLVRENDNRIVGMINIRLALNENLKKYGGHIGYSIRPTERGKGYNKINLYLGLLFCQSQGINEVLLDCDKDNPASANTMIALGGNLVKEYFDDEHDHCIVQDYIIDVNKSVKDNKSTYEPYIDIEKERLWFLS